MMVDETKDLLVNLLSMSKGELVDVIEMLNDDLQSSCNKAIDERDDALQQVDNLTKNIEDLKRRIDEWREIATRWEKEYKYLFDLVAAGATIEDGKLVYDEAIQSEAKHADPFYKACEAFKNNPKERFYGVQAYAKLKANGGAK